MPSLVQVDTLQDLAGNERFTAAAWVNFNGTGTVTINDGGNVASITDNGVGDYTVNFATPLSHANYAPLPSLDYSSFAPVVMHSDYTASSFRLRVFADTAGATDRSTLTVVVFA